MVSVLGATAVGVCWCLSIHPEPCSPCRLLYDLFSLPNFSSHVFDWLLFLSEIKVCKLVMDYNLLVQASFVVHSCSRGLF